MINNKRYQKYFRVLGIILFLYILSRIDLNQLLVALKEINLVYYLISILFLIIALLVRILRWQRLISSVGAKVSTAVLFRIMLKSLFLGTITPGKLGEFWRVKYLVDVSAISNGRAFYTAFMDRLADLLVLGVVAVFGFLFLHFKFYVLFSAIFIFLFFIFLKKLGLHKILKIFTKHFLPAALKEKTDGFLADFDGSFNSLRLRLFSEILAYSLLYYSFSIVGLYFLTLALGITIPFWFLFFVAAIVWLALALPLTFLGLGVREAGFIYFFSILGVSPSLTVAFTLLNLFSNLFISIPGAILFLTQRKQHEFNYRRKAKTLYCQIDCS